MPRFRPEIKALTPYEAGRRNDEVARDLGVDPESIAKLTANESPEGPFPGVVEAGYQALLTSNRYPDNDLWELSSALAAELEIPRESLLFGNGSTALLTDLANVVGGPGTSVVYAWPSFVMYRFVAVWAGSRHVEVPLDDKHALDLDAILAAIDPTTSLIIVCNPNNPTGTITSSDDIAAFIDEVPDDVLVCVDEAYHEFVTDPSYGTAISHAVERPNVIVLRTFSKIFGLAAHRVGYAIGNADTLTDIRKGTQPLTINSVAQAAALASLGQPEEISRRSRTNAAARHHLSGVLAERGLDFVESQTNFIYFRMPSGDSKGLSHRFVDRGVIIRALSKSWLRVTVGSASDNQAFVSALDGVLENTVD